MTISVLQQNPLLWHEGMLLAPQHFQQNDIYWQHQLCQAIAQIQPYYWGVISMDLNQTLVDKGLIEVTDLHAVMADGSHIIVNEETVPSALSCNLDDSQALKNNKPTGIYLCVPYRLEGAASSQGMVQRFIQMDGGEVVDEASGQGRVPVIRMRPNIRLSFDKLSNHYCLLLMVVRKGIDKKNYGITGYHPPLLHLRGADFQQQRSLRYCVRQLAALIREKAIQLSRTNSHSRQFLYALTSSLPPLEVLVQAPGTHPFALYQALAQLLGHASALTESPVPPQIAAYDHDNPAKCFFPLLSLLRQLIADIVIKFRYKEFTYLREQTFELQIQSEWLQQELVIEVVPASGQTFADIEQWLDKARIGSVPVLSALKDRRSPGARAERLSDTERFHYNQSGSAMMFRIYNRTLQIDQKDIKVIQPDQPLQIIGEHHGATPAAIILYVRNNVGSG
ncbi:type VI secretion system baseplate subunit TssK [Gynuella sunshinyii]|uniref:Type VI secretion protein, VC_A0114 family n=1 Tax=Gynuella sunshinyii YC6258 TaxID=1445510 RepID=A0A0C5VTK3_9GAMM|nr:type VI secretion system baseplate subunit TssK [Gynuella sunshinyii]AJQ97516.1 hypothetical protein YC6258_05488 [Gynuella sunshinyii YC6258]